jgi:hypothetical protein
VSVDCQSLMMAESCRKAGITGEYEGSGSMLFKRISERSRYYVEVISMDDHVLLVRINRESQEWKVFTPHV